MPAPRLTLMWLTACFLSQAAWAIELPSAGSLGKQLQQDSPPAERSPAVEPERLKAGPSADQTPLPASRTTVRVNRVVFEGAQAMSPVALESVVTPWLNRDVTLADLHQMTVALEQLYAQHGFLAVRVLIPQQTMHQSTLTVRVIEGRYAPPQVKAADPRQQALLQNTRPAWRPAPQPLT